MVTVSPILILQRWSWYHPLLREEGFLVLMSWYHLQQIRRRVERKDPVGRAGRWRRPNIHTNSKHSREFPVGFDLLFSHKNGYTRESGDSILGYEDLEASREWVSDDSFSLSVGRHGYDEYCSLMMMNSGGGDGCIYTKWWASTVVDHLGNGELVFSMQSSRKRPWVILSMLWFLMAAHTRPGRGVLFGLREVCHQNEDENQLK